MDAPDRTRRPTLGIVAIAFNEERDLEGFLENLLPWVDEIVIVDDGSTDGTEAIARRAGPKVKFVQSPRKPGEYYFDSTTKHRAAIILDKVDPLFVTEVKNAYFRFNRERYRQTFPMNIVDLDANRKILLIGDFASAREALNYMMAARQAAASEVMPWLKAEKYSFSIIDDENLPLLLEKKDLEQYRKFLVQNLPSKF